MDTTSVDTDKTLTEDKTATDMKEKILAFYDKFQMFKTKNELYTKYKDKIELYEKLGGNGRAHEESLKIKKVLDNYIKKTFKEELEDFPNIFNMVVETDIERLTLAHVLDTFAQVKNGEIDAEKGLQQGINYSSCRYNLPANFFLSPKTMAEYMENGAKQEKSQ